MTTEVPEDLRRAQRRGRIVIVSLIVLFLAVCVALGAFLWQREREEARLAELTAPGLLAVGVPGLEWEIDEVSALEDNRGLVTTYRDSDGEPVRQFRLLNIRAGGDQDLCDVLATVEPTLGGHCEVSGLDVSAVATGPDTILHAEGHLFAATLVVLVGHPATVSDEWLRAHVDNSQLMTVEDLARLAD